MSSNNRKTLEIKKNCSGIIISGANVIKTIQIIWVIITSASIAIGLSMVDRDLIAIGVIFGVISAISGIFLAILIGDTLKGFGQVVQNTAESASALIGLCERNGIFIETRQEKEYSDSELVKPQKRQNGRQRKEGNYEEYAIDNNGVVHFHGKNTVVTCPFCEHKQAYGLPACENCNVEFCFD